MTWEGRANVALGMVPDAMPAALAQQFASVVCEMALELTSGHAAARSIVIASA